MVPIGITSSWISLIRLESFSCNVTTSNQTQPHHRHNPTQPHPAQYHLTWPVPTQPNHLLSIPIRLIPSDPTPFYLTPPNPAPLDSTRPNLTPLHPTPVPHSTHGVGLMAVGIATVGIMAVEKMLWNPKKRTIVQQNTDAWLTVIAIWIL